MCVIHLQLGILLYTAFEMYKQKTRFRVCLKEYYAASVFEAVLTFVVYRLSDSVAPDLIRRIWYTFSVLTHSLSRTQTSHRRLSPPAEVDVGDGGHAVRLEEPLHAAERQLCWEMDTFHKFIHSQELYQRVAMLATLATLLQRLQRCCSALGKI